MFKSIEGIYRDGKVALMQLPTDVHDGTHVIVTFFETSPIDLRARGIDEAHAADLRARLTTFAEDWDSPEMDIYDEVVMTDNLATIADSEIDRVIGRLPMNEVDRALRRTLGL